MVSVILPTYNETENIVDLVDQVIPEYSAQLRCEVIVVDDNSPDGTHAAVAGATPIQARNPGASDNGREFAKSIRAGIDGRPGERFVVMDSVTTHDPAEISKLLHVGRSLRHRQRLPDFARAGVWLTPRIILPACSTTGFCASCCDPRCKRISGATLPRGAATSSLSPMDEIFFELRRLFFRLDPLRKERADDRRDPRAVSDALARLEQSNFFE